MGKKNRPREHKRPALAPASSRSIPHSIFFLNAILLWCMFMLLLSHLSHTPVLKFDINLQSPHHFNSDGESDDSELQVLLP